MLIKIENGQPRRYSFYELRKDNPEVLWPNPMTAEVYADYGVYQCTADPFPAHDTLTQFVDFDAYYQDENLAWRASYKTENLPEQDASANIRRERNTLLSASDWTQLQDSPVDSAAWAAYRQELRDLPQQAGFPYSVVWPTEPTS